MGKKSSVKTQGERLQVKMDVEEKLLEMGLHMDSFESLTPFKKDLEDYTQEDILSGFSGKIYIPELERTLEYVLPMRIWAQPMVRLTAGSFNA